MQIPEISIDFLDPLLPAAVRFKLSTLNFKCPRFESSMDSSKVCSKNDDERHEMSMDLPCLDYFETNAVL